MVKIETAHIAVVFKSDSSIVFTLGDAIKKMQKELNAQVQMLNTPSGARPEAPRIIVATNSFIVNIGLNRFDIILNIPNHINGLFDKVLGFCYQSIENISELLVDGYVEYVWTGIILNIHYPFSIKNKRSIELITPVFDRLLNLERKDRSLATFNLQYGYRDENYYINYTIAGYESFSIQIPTNKSEGIIEIGITPDKIDEVGTEVKIDINNKPQEVKTNFISDFSRILDFMKPSLDRVLSETNLKGVIVIDE